jgi:carbon monoxide dehydrogenase subunit G
MQFSGEEVIKAPRQDVWNFLLDPEKATQCAPGLQSVEVIDDMPIPVGSFPSIGNLLP